MDGDDHTEGGEEVLSDYDKDQNLPDLDNLSVGAEKKKHKSKKHKSKKSKHKDKDKERDNDAPGFLPAIVNVTVEPEVWERCDDGRSVYYYNAATGVSAWLAPCSVCHATAAKWCIECSLSFCDHDFEAVHDGEDSAPEMLSHTSSYTEIAGKDVLQPGEVYCLKCNVKSASRLCVQCDDDPYCAECFRMVHFCGYLKCHRAVAYQRAKAGWMIVRNGKEGEPVQYINGTTKEVTLIKPVELQSELEITYLKNYELHKRTAEQTSHVIEGLKKELVMVKEERNTLELEQIKRKAEMAAREAEDKKKSK